MTEEEIKNVLIEKAQGWLSEIKSVVGSMSLALEDQNKSTSQIAFINIECLMNYLLKDHSKAVNARADEIYKPEISIIMQ